MDFARYRELRGWTLERAADEIKASGQFKGVNASLIAKHEAGRHMPRPDLVLRYAEITDNAVTYADWLDAFKSAASKRDEAQSAA